MVKWTDEAIAARMAEGWSGGLLDGTPCGSGSTLKNAKDVSLALPALLRRHKIETLHDAGAGDLHWINLVPLGVRYRAFDLVPRATLVEPWDITKQELPPCDAILCRHVLIHFDPPRIDRTLELFRQSAKYLIASQYDGGVAFDTKRRIRKGFDPHYDYNPTDLRPLLGEPLERLPDTGSDLALWRLDVATRNDVAA